MSWKSSSWRLFPSMLSSLLVTMSSEVSIKKKSCWLPINSWIEDFQQSETSQWSFFCKSHAGLSLVQTQSHTLMPGINHAAAHNYHICMMEKTFVYSYISPSSLALLSNYHFWEYFLIKNTFLNKLWHLHPTQCFPFVPLGGAQSLSFWFWYKDGVNKYWWERRATGEKA